MKRLLILLGLALVLTGCGSTGNSDTTNPNQGTEETPEVFKAGAASTTVVTAKDVVDGAGSVQFETTYAAVVTDAEGIIKYVSIDTALNTVNVDGAGLMTAPETTATKKELGDAYGMGAFAAAGEWDVQIAALETYMVGKNINDVLAMETENGKAVDADLLSGCTIGIEGYLAAVSAAYNNAVEVENAAKAAVGSLTTIAAKDVVDGAGSVEADTTYAMYVTDAEGVVVFVAIDTALNNVTVDGTGVMTAPETTATKKELGDAYGMGAFAAAGEWDQQIAALEAHLVGKALSDALTLATENGKAVDADLLSGCTIGIEGYLAALNAASAYETELK